MEERIRRALAFASEVGVLQYYPQVDAGIILVSPLTLVQAFGVVIYDEEAYRHHIAGARAMT